MGQRAPVRVPAGQGGGRAAVPADRLCHVRLGHPAKVPEGGRFVEGRTRTLSMLLWRALAPAGQLQGPAGDDERRGGAARSTEPREACDAVIERVKS